MTAIVLASPNLELTVFNSLSFSLINKLSLDSWTFSEAIDFWCSIILPLKFFIWSVNSFFVETRDWFSIFACCNYFSFSNTGWIVLKYAQTPKPKLRIVDILTMCSRKPSSCLYSFTDYLHIYICQVQRLFIWLGSLFYPHLLPRCQRFIFLF